MSPYLGAIIASSEKRKFLRLGQSVRSGSGSFSVLKKFVRFEEFRKFGIERHRVVEVWAGIYIT